MEGFRGLASGKPNTISSISNTLNPSILADTKTYQAPVTQSLNNIQVPLPNNLTNEFNNHQTIIPKVNQQNILMQRKTNDMQKQLIQMQNDFELMSKNKKQKQNQNPNQLVPIQRQPPQQTLYMQPQMPLMYPPQQFMQQHYNVYNNLIHPQMMQRPIINNNNLQKQTKTNEKEKDKISTNGTKDMKDEKEVNNELESLVPHEDDMENLNNVLKDLNSDPEMKNSSFVSLLKKISQKKPTTGKIEEKKNEEFDYDEEWLKNWQKQFANYNPIDNMNWNSYMNDINPLVKKDLGYEFAKENHFIKENEEVKKDEKIINNKNEIDLFKEGLRLMKSDNLNEAILAFEAVVKKQPNRSEAWRYLGKCHADNENERQAIFSFKKCYDLDPYDLYALLNLGVSYTNEIDPFSALKYLKEWIANHPDYNTLIKSNIFNNNNNNNMNGWMGQQEEHKKVVNLFLKAVNINKSDVELHTVLGVLYNLTSEYDKAEIHFRKAVQLKPDDPSLWNKLGATLANGQKCNEAIKAYSKALNLKPNYVRAYSNLGISFANQDMHYKACQAYLTSLKRNPSADSVWDHLSQSLIALNKPDLVQLIQKRDVNLFKKHFEF